MGENVTGGETLEKNLPRDLFLLLLQNMITGHQDLYDNLAILLFTNCSRLWPTSGESQVKTIVDCLSLSRPADMVDQHSMFLLL